MRALIAVAVLAAIAAAVTLGSEQPPQRAASPRRTSTPTPTVTPSPPALDRAVLNRQDRSDRRHRQREARAFDSRPLLSQFPLELGEVRIDIAGLAADGHTTIVMIDPGRRSHEFAHAVYERALTTYGDSGTAYKVKWMP